MATNTPTPQDIWSALRNAGASAIQAAGIMGNMLAESSFDVESHNPHDPAQGCPGAQSWGLVNWNDCSHPNARGLVTGNPQNDLKAQIAYLVQSGGLAAATGNDPASAGASFAANYERCQGCSGGAQQQERARNAASVYQAATSGDWSSFSAETAVNAAADQNAPGAGQGSGVSGCAVPLPSIGPIGGGCLITNSQVKALKGGLLVIAGGTLFVVGGLVLVAYGFQRTGAAGAASKALQATPVGRGATQAGRAAGGRTGASQTRRQRAARQRSDLRRDIASGKVTYPDEADEPRVQTAARQSSARNQEIARRRRSDYDRRITRRSTAA